ncbi:unnamed protein product [Prorocentrum cordatum]|uniref:Uncharacterized protein n=1 Tax=Prorocentrum cordatum TaxID=2364126 RepID=A0ABN9XVF9_9DINO|nr:unnamed protein product [Polarella glacialis]
MLLSAMRRDVAYSLLLELATEESEVITSSLVLKCLRKLNKTLATARQPDQEVTGVMEVLRAWLQRAHARLAQGAAEGPGGPVDVAVSALMEGAKEVAASAQNASPRAVEAWLRQARGPEADALQELALCGRQGERARRPRSASGGCSPRAQGGQAGRLGPAVLGAAAARLVAREAQRLAVARAGGRARRGQDRIWCSDGEI